MTLTALRSLASAAATDTSNPLIAHKSVTVRLHPRARRSLTDSLIDAGFRSFRGVGSGRLSTMSRGAVPADCSAESVTYDAATGFITYEVVELTDAGLAAR